MKYETDDFIIDLELCSDKIFNNIEDIDIYYIQCKRCGDNSDTIPGIMEDGVIEGDIKISCGRITDSKKCTAISIVNVQQLIEAWKLDKA